MKNNLSKIYKITFAVAFIIVCLLIAYFYYFLQQSNNITEPKEEAGINIEILEEVSKPADFSDAEILNN